MLKPNQAMADKYAFLQKFIQSYINFYANPPSIIDPKPRSDETTYAILLYFLIDYEHGKLELHLYLSVSPDEEDWLDDLGESWLYDIDVNDEDYEIVDKLYDELQDPELFAKILLDILKKLDYTELDLHEDIVFRTKHIGYF